MPVLRRSRGPHAAGDAHDRRARGGSASSRTSTPRSSGRRSSSTRRSTCARSPSSTTNRSALVAEAWRRRREAEPAGYLHAIVNEGKAAGGSLAHSHSQLVWLPGPPPRSTAEHGEPDRDNVVRRARGPRRNVPAGRPGSLRAPDRADRPRARRVVERAAARRATAPRRPAPPSARRRAREPCR